MVSRELVRLVVCGREVGKPVFVEIRDGQVDRILAGGRRWGHEAEGVEARRANAGGGP